MSTELKAASQNDLWTSVERTSNSADFFDAAARRELLLKRCVECSHLRIARRQTCRQCGSLEYSETFASGTGALISWAAHPPRGSAPRRVFGMVELDEGPWMESALIDIDDDVLRVGLKLKTIWIRGEQGETYPAFTAAK